jgi:hypothetical protein
MELLSRIYWSIKNSFVSIKTDYQKLYFQERLKNYELNNKYAKKHNEHDQLDREIAYLVESYYQTKTEPFELKDPASRVIKQLLDGLK